MSYSFSSNMLKMSNQSYGSWFLTLSILIQWCEWEMLLKNSVKKGSERTMAQVNLLDGWMLIGAHVPDIFLLVLSVQSLITVMSAGLWPSQTPRSRFLLLSPLLSLFCLNYSMTYDTCPMCFFPCVFTKVTHWNRLHRRKSHINQCDAFKSRLTTVLYTSINKMCPSLPLYHIARHEYSIIVYYHNILP